MSISIKYQAKALLMMLVIEKRDEKKTIARTETIATLNLTIQFLYVYFSEQTTAVSLNFKWALREMKSGW